MKTHRIVAVAVAWVCLAGVAAAAEGAKAGAPGGAGKKGHLTPVEGIKWMPYDPKQPDGPLQVATVWGDRAKAPVGFLLKVPGGFKAPEHAHSNDYDAVVVKGTWRHTFDAQGEAKTTGGPGTFWHQPGKAFHGDACESDSECIVLVSYQKGKPDFITKPEAKAASGGPKKTSK